MLRGPDSTGTSTVPIPTIPTRNVSATPSPERPTAAASDALRTTPDVVVVRQGDTLGSLAARYHVTIAELKELNPDLFVAGKDAHGRKRAANGHWIYPGDQVRLKAGMGTGTGASTEALAAQVRAAQAASKPTAETTQTEAPAAKAETSEQTTSQAAVAQDQTTQPAAETTSTPSESKAVKAETSSVKTEPAQVESTEPAAPKATTETTAATPAKSSEPMVQPATTPEPVKVVDESKPAPKQPDPPAPPVKAAHVYGVEQYQPHPKPASPPPVPTTMAEGQRLNKNEKLIIGGLLAGLSLFKFPDKLEKSIGDNAVDDVLTKYPLYTRNPEIVRYVASVGEKLINQSNRTDLDWRFYVVDSPQINAFALPGGHVFITTAALRNLKSEAELAGVLGHEISHVEKRHSVKQLQKTMLAQGIAIAALGDQSAGVQVASQLAIGIAMNGYSRSNEDEADLRGAELAYKAGYDPNGLVHFFETLKQVHPDSPEWMAWASDHPQTGNRIEHVTEHINKEGLTGRQDDSANRYHQVMSRM